MLLLVIIMTLKAVPHQGFSQLVFSTLVALTLVSSTLVPKTRDTRVSTLSFFDTRTNCTSVADTSTINAGRHVLSVLFKEQSQLI
jgi:hypothetical protein